MSLRTLMPFARSGSVESRTNTDPFQVMRHEMERVFDRFDPAWRGSSGFNGNGFDIPSVDIAESETELEISAELPGFKPEEVELNVADGVMTLKAEHSEEHEKKDKKKQYHLVERMHGALQRQISLPAGIDEDQIKADFQDGVLKITVPKTADTQQKSRQISIQSH